MTPDRDQIEEIVAAALGRVGAERDVYLDSACGSNADLRSAVDSLLTNASWAEDFLETPIAGSISKTMLRERGSLVGKQLGVYRIESAIDGGGQGDVYKGYDTRMACAVAIKVLPPEMASRSDLRQRFEREARAVAGLSHPHICTPHYFGHQDGIDYLVMDYLDGETLAHRLKKGPLPLEQALRYAIEVAGALAYAHRHGVIHRDLKPGNIMLVKSGAKVLDFGLAKVAKEQRSKAGHETRSMTEEGVIVGTLQYMAPEQLEAQQADARTDIFAFGAVLYEMLTGKKAFEGKSQASLIAAIMSAEPASITALQPMSPSALERVVKKCLAKDPSRRWQTADDLEDELQWIGEGGSLTSAAIPRKSTERFTWVAITLLLAALALSGYFYRPQIAQVPVRFQIFPPDNVKFADDSPTLSPDGHSLAFTATLKDSTTQIWVHSLDTLTARPLAGTQDGYSPFWSPDSRFIGFFVNRKLKKVTTFGEQVQTLCDGANGPGAWGRDGTILFSGSDSQIHRVSAGGGMPSLMTKRDSQREYSHRWPQFLPDGRHFLYVTSRASVEGSGLASDLYAGSLEPAHPEAGKRLLSTEGDAPFVVAGTSWGSRLLFWRRNALMAQAFDPKRLELTGEAVIIAEQGGESVASAYRPFSVSENGSLAFSSQLNNANKQLVWYDRTGKRLSTLGEPAPIFAHPRLSPDQKHLIVARENAGNIDLWLYDLYRSGPASRVTFAPARDDTPAWSPDGGRIAFRSNREGGVSQIYQTNTNGSGSDALVLKAESLKAESGMYITDWSLDGRFLSYGQNGIEATGSHWHMWVLPLDGGGKPFRIWQSDFNDRGLSFSPDVHWVAYESDESGRSEVYIRPFTGAPADATRGAKHLVSSNGGFDPRWRRDGKELYYLAPDGTLMAVAVHVTGGSALEAGAPKVLFNAFEASEFDFTKWPYDVTPDGQRFILIRNVQEAFVSSPVTVVLNWEAGLKGQTK